jgi:hypothetical protein
MRQNKLWAFCLLKCGRQKQKTASSLCRQNYGESYGSSYSDSHGLKYEAKYILGLKKKPEKKPKFSKKPQFLIIAFALIIALPLLDNIFHFSPVKNLFEKRSPAALPKFPQNFSAAALYFQDLENFFNDHYGFRKTLVAINGIMMDNIFNESPDARAIIGKDGWFYFDNYNSLLDAMAMASISDELIEHGVKSFGQNWQKMRAQNINYLLVIAADKSTIYPDFLPFKVKAAANKLHRIDRFLNALKKKYPDFPVLDLRFILKKAREKEIIYHKTDTHWNKRGAHYAYVEIMKMLSKKNLHFKPHLRNDFANKEDEFVRGDISDIMGVDTRNLNYDLTAKFPENFYQVQPGKAELKFFHKPNFFANKNKNLPVIFVYKDSYFGDLFGFVAQHFSRAFFINEFPCDLDYDIIKNYHPDVVIQEFWEGRIELVLGRCNTNSHL